MASIGPVRCIGMVWYTLENYSAIKAAMKDGNRLPATYSQWRISAEQGERKFRREGYLVVRAHLELDTFREFCRARGQDLDAKARMDFANLVAYQEHGKTH